MSAADRATRSSPAAGCAARTSSAAPSSCARCWRASATRSGCVGARRLGKTSLLKELEYRVQQSRRTPFVPLYWDLQGSGDARGLADGLLGSVEDSEAFRRATDVAVEDLEGLAVADMLTTLVRRTVRSGWRLLLLVDEAEELLTVAPRRRLRCCRGCGASSRRGPRCARCSPPPSAWPASTSGPTSPPRRSCRASSRPLYLTPLARRRGARAAGARPVRAPTRSTTIMERTGLPPVPGPAHRQPPVREPRPRGHARPGGRRRDGGELLLRGLPDPRRRRARASWRRWRARAAAHARRAGPGRCGRAEEALEPLLFGLAHDGLPGARRRRATASATGSSSAG